jgi:hypothetical protein
MANAARFNLDADLAGARFWNIAFYDFKITAGFVDLDSFHPSHLSASVQSRRCQ